MERPYKMVRRGGASSCGAPTPEFALERLPDELLLITMSLLPVADLATFARVCRRFADLFCDESLWRVHVGRLTCRAPSEVSKATSRSWRKHYQRLSSPPTSAALCRDLLDPSSFVILDGSLYIASASEIVQYRAPVEPGLIDEGNVVGRLPSAEGHEWKYLERLGPSLVVKEFKRDELGIKRVVLLDRNLTVLHSIRPRPDRTYTWLLFDGRLVGVDNVFPFALTCAEPSPAGVADQAIGRLPFRIDFERFEFVATRHSFGAIVCTSDDTGFTSGQWFGDSGALGQVKFVEISTDWSAAGGSGPVVLDEVVLPLPVADPDLVKTMELACIDDAYLVLSLSNWPDTARLDVFAVQMRRTTSMMLPPSMVDDANSCVLWCASAPATGLLYVWVWLDDHGSTEQRPLLLALNSSGACLWRSELPVWQPSAACDAALAVLPPLLRLASTQDGWLVGVDALGCYLVLAVASTNEGAVYRDDSHIALIALA